MNITTTIVSSHRNEDDDDVGRAPCRNRQADLTTVMTMTTTTTYW